MSFILIHCLALIMLIDLHTERHDLKLMYFRHNDVSRFVGYKRFYITASSHYSEERSMAKFKNSLEYHASGRKGKIEVVSTKPCQTAEDLSLAYSPGVAEPCLAIQQNPEDAYKYTDRKSVV